jgi:hypothetical protein
MAINTSYMLANMLNSLGILEDPYEMEGSGDLLIDKVKNLHKVTEANRNDANRLKIALMGE